MRKQQTKKLRKAAMQLAGHYPKTAKALYRKAKEMHRKEA